jgi:hypothetical protein
MSSPRTERPAMSDYGVPDDLDGTLPWSWAQERLVRSRNYWLATVSADGRPHAMPVWGVWSVERDVFWFGCSPKARKARNLAANPRCVVAPDDTVECVSVEGVATQFHDDDRLAEMTRLFLAKYGDEAGDPVEFDAFMRANSAFEVAPDRAFGIIERAPEFSERATRWVF